jgi:hypothetical protein
MVGSTIEQFSKVTWHSSFPVKAKGSAHPINVERVSEENANTDENTRRCDDLGHSFPPRLVMPGRAARRNWW